MTCLDFKVQFNRLKECLFTERVTTLKHDDDRDVLEYESFAYHSLAPIALERIGSVQCVCTSDGALGTLLLLLLFSLQLLINSNPLVPPFNTKLY